MIAQEQALSPPYFGSGALWKLIMPLAGIGKKGSGKIEKLLMLKRMSGLRAATRPASGRRDVVSSRSVLLGSFLIDVPSAFVSGVVMHNGTSWPASRRS